MPEVLLVVGAVALVVVAAVYLVNTVRILARTGDIDEPLPDDETTERPTHADR